MIEDSNASRHGHADAADPGRSAPAKASGRQRIVNFECSGCEHSYRVPEKYAGRTVRCKKCDAFTVIPIPDGPASDMEDSELDIDMDDL